MQAPEWWINFLYWKDDTWKLGLRMLLLVVLVSAVACLVIGLSYSPTDIRGKWVNSAGLLFDAAAIVQLNISGLLRKL